MLNDHRIRFLWGWLKGGRDTIINRKSWSTYYNEMSVQNLLHEIPLIGVGKLVKFTMQEKVKRKRNHLAECKKKPQDCLETKGRIVLKECQPLARRNRREMDMK